MEEIVSGNGLVGKKGFRTKVPFQVKARVPIDPRFGPGQMNFVVISGGGTLEPALGNVVPSFGGPWFTDREVSDFITLELVDGQAAVYYTAVDDDRPSIIAAFLSPFATAPIRPGTAYAGVAPPDVRLVSKDGLALAGVPPADLRHIDPQHDGFHLEARLPIGYDVPIEGRLATLTRLGALAAPFPQAAAPVALTGIGIAPVSSDLLGATWRSDPERPFVAILDTFLDPSEVPPLTGPFQPIQVPRHGWILPKVFPDEATTNDEGDRVAEASIMVQQMYFYDGEATTSTTPPAAVVDPEAATPILGKAAVRRHKKEPLAPVVYCIQMQRPVNEDYFEWTIVSPRGEEILLKQTLEPRIHLWFQDDPGNTTRDDDPLVLDEDDPLHPAIVGVAESDANLRGTWKIRMTAYRLLDPPAREPAEAIARSRDLEINVATRSTHGRGYTNTRIFDDKLDLEDEFGDYPGETYFTDPPEGDDVDTDAELIAEINRLDRRTAAGFRLWNWYVQIKVHLEMGVTDYWKRQASDRFRIGHRLLWIGLPDSKGQRGATLAEGWSADELDSFLTSPPPPAHRALKIYGTAMHHRPETAANDADIGQVVMLHERIHVLELAQYHEREFPILDSEEEAMEDPRFHAVLVGRAIQSFRECLQEQSGQPSAQLRARAEYNLFAGGHSEIGAYASEMRWFRIQEDEFGAHPARKLGQTWADRDRVIGSHSLYFHSSKGFVGSYARALLYSFEPLSYKIEQGEFEPFCAAGRPDGEIRRRLLQYFVALFHEGTLRMPEIYGGAVEVRGRRFQEVMRNTGRDANNPWVIYLPFVPKE